MEKMMTKTKMGRRRKTNNKRESCTLDIYLNPTKYEYKSVKSACHANGGECKGKIDTLI